MNKDERKFLELFVSKSGLNDIKLDGIQANAKPRQRSIFLRRSFLIPAISASAALVLAISIALPISLNNTSEGSNPATSVPSSDPGLPEMPKKQKEVANLGGLVTTYERNAMLIEDGLGLSDVKRNGKQEVRQASSVSSDFAYGVPGDYEVSVATDDGSASYQVEVIDKAISSINVSFDKKEYFEGESPLVSDFSLIKVLDDGTEVAAKPSEIGLDISDFPTEVGGKGSVRVYLKSNESFFQDVDVTLQPLEELSLEGDWAYKDVSALYGAPTVHALHVDENNLFSNPYSFSEIFLLGSVSFEVEDGKVRIYNHDKESGEATSQEAVYDPATRTISLDGIAGDPSMELFHLSKASSIIRVEYQMDLSTRLYVAVDGYLDQDANSYISFLGGGLYLGRGLTTPYDGRQLSHYELLYSGIAEIDEDYSAYLQGDYVSADSYPYEVRIRISGDEYSTYGYDDAKPYRYTFVNSEMLVYLDVGSAYFYVPETDSLEARDIDGNPALSFRKLDDSLALVRIEDDKNGQNKVYAINKGEPFPGYSVEDGGEKIVIFHLEGYDGSPIYDEATIKGRVGYFDLFSLSPQYGSLNDYYELTSGYYLGIDDSRHYLAHYVNLQLVDYGRIALTGMKDGQYSANLAFASGDKQALLGGSSSLAVDGVTYMALDYLYAGLPFIGEYYSASGQRLQIDKNSSFSFVRTNEATGYRYWEDHASRLVAFDDETGIAKLQVYDISSATTDIPTLEDYSSVIVTLTPGEDGFYSLHYKGESYLQKSKVPDYSSLN